MTSTSLAQRRPSLADLDEAVAGLGRDLESLRGKRLFVTGATGFFGRWLLEVLHHANVTSGALVDVVGLARDPGRLVAVAPHLASGGRIEFVAGDVRDFEWPSGRFDLVLHAAAPSDARVYATNPVGMYDTIVGGTRRVLEFAKHCAAEGVLFVSSGAIYGPQPSELTHVPETYLGGPDPMSSASLYGEAKRAAELLCTLAAERDGLRVVSARCFAFVGPYLPLDWHFAVGNFIRDALAGGPIRVRDGTPFRSYMYPTDLVRWLVVALVRGKGNRAYNVGSDDDVTIATLAHEIGEMTGVEVRMERAAPALGPVQRYVPSVARARAELGLGVRVDRRESLARTLEFHGWHARALRLGDEAALEP